MLRCLRIGFSDHFGDTNKTIMKEAAYKVGDKVRVVNYGHAIWEHKSIGESSFPLIKELESLRLVDLQADLIGQQGVIDRVLVVTQGRPKYSVDGISGKTAWYNEDQLEAVTDLPGTEGNTQGEIVNICIVNALRLDEEHRMMILEKLMQSLSNEGKKKLSELVEDEIEYEKVTCPCCGSDKTIETKAVYCKRCAVTSDI